MPRNARPFMVTLNESQAAAILDPSGKGGQQDLAVDVRLQLQAGKRTVILDDAQLGKLVRYMTSYGPGGFQSRLRRAFREPMIELLRRPLVRRTRG